MQLQAEGSFNSIKVRLKRYSAVRDICQSEWFQFHKGPIKALQYLLARFKAASFNSIKVRLKQPPIKVHLLARILFQFHKGPIKAVSPSSVGFLGGSVSIP